MKISISKLLSKNMNVGLNAFNFLKQYKNDSSIYIRISDIDKFGINPHSTDTDIPTGISCWNLYDCWREYKFYQEGKINLPSPAENKWKYIHVFRLKTDSLILDLSDVKTFDYFSLERELKQKYGIPRGQMISKSKTLDNKAGIKFWRLSHRLAQHHSKNPSVAWNKILRKLGFSAVKDSEGSVFQYPCQSIVLDPRKIKHIETFSINGTKLNLESIV
jgi:hypothetical protein